MKLLRVLPALSVLSVLSTAGYCEADINKPAFPVAQPSAIEPCAVSAADKAAQFTGLSLGINGGFIHVSADTSWTNYIPSNGLQGFGGRYTTTAKGGFAGVHAILGKVYPSKFYIGGEITAAYNIVNGTNRDYILYGERLRYSLKDSYSAAIRAGTLAGDALVYVKAGAAYSRRVVEAQYIYSQVVGNIYKSTKYNVAPLVGFGFDVPLKGGISLGLEANYVKYPSDTVVYANAAQYTFNTDTYDFKVKLTFKI